jgi:hypothetical protein
MSQAGGFTFRGPRVLGVRAEGASTEVEQHLNWFVTLGHDDQEENYRVVIATLHGSWENARAEVTVGVQIGWIGTPIQRSEPELLAAIASSEALESTYDFARAFFVPLLATVSNEVIEIPVKSPPADVTFYEDSVENAPDVEPSTF